MLVVETLVALVEHSLLYEPTPVPAFQLVLNSVGARPGTSRSAVADVLAESSAASVVRHIPCIPPNVPSEALLEELATWAGLGASGGGGVGGEDPRGSHWASSFTGSGSALTGFGLNRVVPLDPLVVFLAVAGSGSLEERTLSAFWTLDREGAGYLTLEQLLRLSGLLLAVAAAGRLILNQPPLPRGLASESLGVRGGPSPNPSPASTIPGQALRSHHPHHQPPSPGMTPMDAGGLPRGTDCAMAAAVALQPQPTVPMAAPGVSAAASGGTAAAGGDGSRALLDSALTGAFHEHCLPAEGPGGPPARLTADRLVLVVQSAAEYITMAVVHCATAPHALSGDSSYGHHPRSGFLVQYQPHHHHHSLISRRSFGASGAAAAVHASAHARGSAGQLSARTSSHTHHSLQPSYHHQRQNSSHGPMGGPLPPLPPLAPLTRLQRTSATAAAAIADGGGGSSNGYSPSQRQCAAPFQSPFQNPHADVATDRGSANQLLCVTPGSGTSYGDAALNPKLSSNAVHFLGGNGVVAVAPLNGVATSASRAPAASASDLLTQSSDVLRGQSSFVAVTATASSSVLIMGAKSVATNGEAKLPAATTTATVAASWMQGWTGRRAEPGAPSPLATNGNLTTYEAPQQFGSWLAGSFWAATSYVGGALWGVGRPTASKGRSVLGPAVGAGSDGAVEMLARGPHLVGPATGAMAAPKPGCVTRPGLAGLTESPPLPPPLAALTRGATAAAPSVAAAAVPLSASTRGSPLGRVSEHTDLLDIPERQSTVRHTSAASPAAAAGGVTPSSVGMGHRSGSNLLAGVPGLPAEGSSVSGLRKQTDPAAGTLSSGVGGGGLDVGRAAAVDMSSMLPTDAGPALLADFTEAEKPALGGGSGSAGGSGGGAGGGGGTADGVGGGGSGSVTSPNRTVSGLLTKWRRASKSVAPAGDVQGSPGQVTAAGTPAMQSAGGAGSGGVAAEQNQGRDGAVVDDGSNGGTRRRTHPAFVGGGTGGSDGSVHGGAAVALQRGPGLDAHLVFSSPAHASHSIEAAASRAELAAKYEAAAAFTRGGAAAATVGGAGGIAGGRDATTAPAGAAGGSGGGGGGTVLPPLQRAIRSSVQQAGVKLFLHCGMCLLAIIALLLLDAALVAWIYLDRKQRLSRSLIIVAATNTGLVLLVLLISIVRSFMADRAAALEVAAARQAARGGAAAGNGGGGASGVLGFLLSNFVTPTLQTMGMMRGPEEAAAGRATHGPGAHSGGHVSGGHEGGGWGTKLRMLWTTVGRIAGFDTAEDHGSGSDAADAGGSGPGRHPGPLHANSALSGPQYDYTASHAAFDLEARAGGGAAGGLGVAGGAGLPGINTGLGCGGGGGSVQHGSSPYAPDGARRSLGLGAGGSPFTSFAMGTPETGTMMAPEVMGMGTSSAGVGAGGARGVGGGAGGTLSSDPRVGGGASQLSGGTAARERTRGSALPATYYSSVPTMQRMEAAYPVF